MKEVDIERLTLSNAGGGQLEEQFQKCLGELLAIQDNREEYETSKKSIPFKISAEIYIELNEAGDGMIHTQCDAKGPKRKIRKQTMNIMKDKVMVRTAALPEQMPISEKVAGKIGK